MRALTGALLLSSILLADVSSTPRGFDPGRTALLKLLGGKGTVYYSCAFSPDGKVLAAGSLQGPVHVFQSRTWEKVFELEGHAGGVWTLAFSPDGKKIATGGQNGEIKLWDMSTHKEIRQVGAHQAMVWGMSFSPDGTRLATCAMDGTTRLWDPEKGEEKVAIQGTHPNSRPVIFTPDSASLICTINDGSLRIYNAKDGSEKKTIETNNMPVTSAVLARDGRTLYGVGMDGALRSWDIISGKEISSLPAGGRGRQTLGMALTSDSRYLVVGDASVLKIYDTKASKLLHSLRGHRSAIYAVSISPDNRYIASASAEGALNVWGYKPSAVASASKRRGYLGVTVQTIEIQNGVNRCQLQSVLQGTAADGAHLQVGDLLLKVGKTDIQTQQEAIETIGSLKEGEEVEIVIERDGKEQKIKVKLGAHPDDQDPQDE